MNRERRRPKSLSLDAIAADLAAAPTPTANAPPTYAPTRARPGLTLGARWAYATALTCAALWIGSFLAFVGGFGRLGAFDFSPFRDTIVAAMAVLPALFMLLFAYALRQGVKLGDDVRTTRRLSEDLVGPLALSAVQTGDLMIAMRAEIERAAEVAAEAERQLQGLREGITAESARLTEAAQEAQAGARTLGEALGRERGELYTLTATLEARTLEVTEAVGRQSRLAADVSDLAQAQLSEAQAALTARAADLTAAAADVRDSADAAAEVLARHTENVGVAGDTLAQRLTRLGDDLGQERDRLAALAEGLKTDHEDLSARAETQHARMAEVAQQARADGEAASLAATDAAELLRGLIAEAAGQVRLAAQTGAEVRGQAAADAEAQLSRFAEVAEQTRAKAQEQAQESLAALTGAAAGAQSVAAARLAELQEQAQSLGAVALDRIEQVNEAAFAAGQRADQAFDSRILAAKRAIDQSATAVEDAGLRAAQRIEAGLGAARAALAELDGLLAEVDGRFETLPEEARVRAEAVRSVMERGVGDLTAAARRAAEETQAIDSAFQERVKRNYDTLSEAVRLMGRVAGAVDAAARAPEAKAPAPTPTAPPAQIHALDLTPKPRETAAERPLAEPVAQPLAQPLPMAVGDSHARFAPAASAAAASTAEPPKLLLRTGAESAPLATGWTDGGASDLFAPTAPSSFAEPPSAESLGLRPRLKLTPTSEITEAPKAATTSQPEPSRTESSRPPVGANPAWSWKDLLSTLPEEPEETLAQDDEALADRLISEIEALGLDAAALLPRAQVEDIAAALLHAPSAASATVARDSVRRLAPAAVRRLARRVLTDTVLRRDAGEFVRRYAALVDDACRRDPEGFLASALLGSDAGRAYLMLDAAIGDLAV